MKDSNFLETLPSGAEKKDLIIRHWGETLYRPVYDAMRTFTDVRKECPSLKDELWVVEHEPVYTMGQATHLKHLPKAGTPGQVIEIAAIDRGGQITYHGPGQLVLYFLLDLTRRKKTVRWLISLMEQLVIDDLEQRGLSPALKPKAPGVYLDGEKIAALGIKVQHGCSYHGLSINVNMDLTPFDWINPCGYIGMPVTQYCDVIAPCDAEKIKRELVQRAIDMLTENP